MMSTSNEPHPDKYSDNENIKEWSSKKDSKLNSDFSQSSVWLNQNRRFLRNAFNQSNLFPNSMVLCFVCGNVARKENTLKLYSRNSRSNLDAPFFPFLEYHDPAPGAEPMREDWSVVSCSLCNALLSQQWKSFERARMPINKRLYWLKRPSGCEIRQPVSQIELEEILNEHSKENCGERDGSESDDDIAEQPCKKMKSSSPASLSLLESNANDFSLKSSAVKHCQNSKQTVTAFVCYSCGKTGTTACSVFPVHCKPSYEQMRAGVPYYPTVLDGAGAPSSTVLYESITFLCMNCLPKYRPEWHFMQKSFLEKDMTKSTLPRIPLPEEVACYLCGSDVSTKYNDGIVHTLTPEGKKNSNYRRLSAHKQLNGAASISFGFTYLCPQCRLRVTNEKKETKSSGCD